VKAPVRSIVVLLAAVVAGCPLPFDFNGEGAGDGVSRDPSSPNITATVTVSYSEQGGSSGSVPDNGAHYSELTTTVTLSTATEHAVIYYTDNGSALTNLGAAKKIDGSSGDIRIARTAALEERDIRAIAIGSGMLPSPPVHATIGVSAFPVLAIARSVASITEDGGTATFTVTATSASAGGITVQLATSGNYEAGDVAGVPGPGSTFTASIPAAATSVVIPITGQPDAGEQNDDTVTVTILADAAYTVGSPASASVVIADNNIQPHGVIYHANGATSGAVPVDATQYLPGATVTVPGNTGNLQRPGYGFAGWNTTAGGGGTTYTAGQTFGMGAADVHLYAQWLTNIYVDGSSGNDANSGLFGTPVRTITRGLALAGTAGVTVHVAPGTYDTAHGEAFPLTVPAGMALIGDEPGKGASTIIDGPDATFVVQGLANSTIGGLTVRSTGGWCISAATADGVTIRNNTVVNGWVGIYSSPGSSNMFVTGNSATGCHWGIGFDYSSGGGRVDGNSATGNYYGIGFLAAGADAGGGAAGSAGGNTFAGNTGDDLWVGVTGVTIYAQNNYWDHVPPVVGTVDGDGADIYATGSTVDTTGAMVAP
jgi:hypothetical protein